jgi:hypothetical protein
MPQFQKYWHHSLSPHKKIQLLTFLLRKRTAAIHTYNLRFRKFISVRPALNVKHVKNKLLDNHKQITKTSQNTYNHYATKYAKYKDKIQYNTIQTSGMKVVTSAVRIGTGPSRLNLGSTEVECKEFSPIHFTYLGDFCFTLLSINCKMNLPGSNYWSANGAL